MYGYYSTCAFMHNFTTTDMSIFFFLSKCVIWSVFCILKDFVSTDADALRACKACYYYYLLSASFWLFNLIMRN